MLRQDTAPAPRRPHRTLRVVAVVAAAVALLVGIPSVRVSTQNDPADAPRWSWLAHGTSARTSIGPIALDGDLEPIVATFGPPQRLANDLGGTGHRWVLEGGAVLLVIVDDASKVVAVELAIPHGSAVRGALDGGLLVGASTVGDVVDRWGPPDATGATFDDFALRYVGCIGPAPVVFKFDVDDRTLGDAARVDRALVAYADEEPGTSGCAWPDGTEVALGRG